MRMPLIVGRILGVVVSLTLLPAALAQSRGPSVPMPLADVHFHFMLFMTPAQLKERMDRHNIQWTVSAGAIGSPAAGAPNFRDAQARELLGDRFIPGVGNHESRQGEISAGTRFYTDEVSSQREEVLKVISQSMAVQPKVLAETYPNAETSSQDAYRRRRVATDGPYFRELMAIGIRESRPVPMHMQFNLESLAQLSKLLQDNPQGQVLLSHCGKDSTAAAVRAMLDKHPNLYCDLSYRGAPLATNESRQDPNRLIFWVPTIFMSAGIKSDWRQLIEDHPDRFMVGIDDVPSWEIYDQTVAAIREGVLAKLTPSTAEKVA